MDDLQVSLPAPMAEGGDMKDLVQMIVLPCEAIARTEEIRVWQLPFRCGPPSALIKAPPARSLLYLWDRRDRDT